MSPASNQAAKVAQKGATEYAGVVAYPSQCLGLGCRDQQSTIVTAKPPVPISIEAQFGKASMCARIYPKPAMKSSVLITFAYTAPNAARNAAWTCLAGTMSLLKDRVLVAHASCKTEH